MLDLHFVLSGTFIVIMQCIILTFCDAASLWDTCLDTVCRMHSRRATISRAGPQNQNVMPRELDFLEISSSNLRAKCPLHYSLNSPYFMGRLSKNLKSEAP